jgi:hypothetical protein
MNGVPIKSMIVILYATSLILASDLQVNIHTLLDQKDPDLAVLNNSQGIVVWNSYGQDSNSGGIFARRMDPNGPIGQEFQINATVIGNQAEPSVTMNIAGYFLVAWRGPWSESDAEDIVARMFDPNGQPLTDDLHVNTYSTARQGYPRVATGPTGRFIVVWESDSSPNASRLCIRGQLYDQTGALLGQEMEISDTPSYAARYPDVAMDSQGRFVVSWMEDRTTDSVRARLFDPNGIPKGASFKVNTISFKSQTWPSMAMNADGIFVIAWDGDPNKASDDDIHARIFDPNATPLADEFMVNTTRSGAQENPRAAIDGQGNIIVVWEGPSADPNGGIDVLAQRFDATGQRLGEELRLNEFMTGNQGQPDVGLGENGRLIAVWESIGQDGSESGIFGVTGP